MVHHKKFTANDHCIASVCQESGTISVDMVHRRKIQDGDMFEAIWTSVPDPCEPDGLRGGLSLQVVVQYAR